MIVPVVLCGGSGTRLWPLSRNSYPKQLLPLVNQQYSLLQETVMRISNVPGIAPPIIICNEVHRFLVAEQLQEIHLENPTLILEPVARNTAPAVTVAALQIQQEWEDALMLVLPADHVIKNISALELAIQKAEKIAVKNSLVTFGISPLRPETGYGYIKRSIKDETGEGFQVEKFVEKPDLKTAQHYVDSGEYFWNSGMFMFKSSVFLNEMKIHAPDMLTTCGDAHRHLKQDIDFIRVDKEIFSMCKNDSIDYAIMEKSSHVAMVILDAQWSDVGCWNALWEVKSSDENGNVIQGDVYTENVTGSYLHAENRMLAVVGVKDHIVVETADAVLVTHKDHCQEVKSIVNLLKNKNRTEIDLHRRVYRPWGYYEVLDGTNEFQVKRIVVKSGARLSLQAHHHRSEHWVVISGIATVTCEDKVFDLKANCSTYIPVGAKHRLENRFNEPLIIIEVQCGDYISEEDIIRFDDQYGRLSES